MQRRVLGARHRSAHRLAPLTCLDAETERGLELPDHAVVVGEHALRARGAAGYVGSERARYAEGIAHGFSREEHSGRRRRRRRARHRQRSGP